MCEPFRRSCDLRDNAHRIDARSSIVQISGPPPASLTKIPSGYVLQYDPSIPVFVVPQQARRRKHNDDLSPLSSLYLLRVSSEGVKSSSPKSRSRSARHYHTNSRRSSGPPLCQKDGPSEPERDIYQCYCGAPLKRYYFGPSIAPFVMRDPKDFCILCSATKKPINKCLETI